ncbi:probable polygalacturonase At3g15720 [Coffea arabica]|uniref:Probable polygalacturonase At3g15720 n=1 Tax=Coffea arabica TaxID=13443 RepID=A0A6P6TSR0_COFAR
MHSMGLQIISLIVCIAASYPDGGLAAVFNVTGFGAIGDGIHDDTEAFSQAWEAACSNGEGSSSVIVPAGRTFLLSPVNFEGPCYCSNVHFQVLGKIVAPNETDAWKGCVSDSWLHFSDIPGLVLEGSGVIDGRGSPWWKNVSLGILKNALHIHKCDGLQLRGLHHVNSPKSHISINKCNGVSISGLNILAPENSPNTDGIDVSESTHVLISDSIIQTGDDCVAINGGSSDIQMTNVSCGPGHGISVGSLGANGSYATVEQVNVTKCNFQGTQNGIRIKTWPGGSGYARNISFEDITLQDVENPIIIDQFYCKGEFKCEDKPSPSAVQVSHVTYQGVNGSSSGEKAIQLFCSESKGCTDIKMQQINITSAIPGAKTYAICKNAYGESSSTSPPVPCLTQHHDDVLGREASAVWV